jgi:hypothetical protein
VYAGLGASFPLTPFIVQRVRSRPSEPRGLHVVDREGHPVGRGLDLSEVDLAEATLLLPDSDTDRTVRVDLRPAGERVLEGALLLDQQNRVIMERNGPLWLFAAPVLHKLLVRGRGGPIGIRTRSVSVEDITDDRPHEPAVVMGLPIHGAHPWYVGVQDPDLGLGRVASGAPRRLNPMDRPEGPFSPVGRDDEIARVKAMLAASQLGGGLDRMVRTMVRDPGEPPWRQMDEQEVVAENGRKQIVTSPRLGTLQMAAIDPGVARYFGFADRLDDLPDYDGQGWDTLAVVGLFAIDPRDFLRRNLQFGALLQGPLPNEDRLVDLIGRALSDAAGEDLRPAIAEMMRALRQRELVVHACVALAAPVPAWVPPVLSDPEILQRRWQGSVDGEPSALYRAGFAFPHAPLASMTALAARREGVWVSRHGTVPVGDREPAQRALPRLLGHEREAASRARQSTGVMSLEPAGLLADQDIPAAGPTSYRVRASDCFGRFGAPVDFVVAAPPRPVPPPPVLRYFIERAEVDLESLDPLSPGELRLTVAVPRALPANRFTKPEEKRLASALVVPRIDDLAAGALRLVSLEIMLAGVSRSVDLSTPGFVDVAFPLPELAPQAVGSWTLTGVFRDEAGVASEPASTTVAVTDARPPQVYPTGLGLFWTSAPGPSPEVELRLWWPAPVGSRHRVYLTDQQGLGLASRDLTERVAGAEPSRGRVAAVGGNKLLAGAPVDRRGFRLLTEQSIVAGSDGRAVLDTRLPRSLRTVQFLRVVPVGPDGAEPPFDSCGGVPVAVPDSRRPPEPRLEGEVNAAGRARLRVVADGFDRVALERDEPGLFARRGRGEPPQYRIRRAVGPVADPIYARTIASGSLELDRPTAARAVFMASVVDDNGGRPLEPFVQYVYWADVRLPPERRLPVGVKPIDPPGGIGPVDPASAASHARPMSRPSAPRVLMAAPADPPAAPADEAVVASRTGPDAQGNFQVSIELSDPPRAHSKAIGPYRLAIWTQWANGPIEPAQVVDGSPLTAGWPEVPEGALVVTMKPPADAAAPGALTLRLAFVDPLGRLGKIASVEVP